MKRGNTVVKCEFIGKFWPEWTQNGTSNSNKRISDEPLFGTPPKVYKVTFSDGRVRERIEFDGRSLI